MIMETQVLSVIAVPFESQDRLLAFQSRILFVIVIYWMFFVNFFFIESCAKVVRWPPEQTLGAPNDERTR